MHFAVMYGIWRFDEERMEWYSGYDSRWGDAMRVCSSVMQVL